MWSAGHRRPGGQTVRAMRLRHRNGFSTLRDAETPRVVGHLSRMSLKWINLKYDDHLEGRSV